MNSFLLNDRESMTCGDALCEWSYNRLLKENKYFSVSDVDRIFDKYGGKVPPHIKGLHDQGFKSAIFAPIANDQGLMGILEIVSEEPQVLNSINANKLVDRVLASNGWRAISTDGTNPPKRSESYRGRNSRRLPRRRPKKRAVEENSKRNRYSNFRRRGLLLKRFGFAMCIYCHLIFTCDIIYCYAICCTVL